MAEQSGSIAVSSGVPIRGLMPGGAIWKHISRFARRKPLGAFFVGLNELCFQNVVQSQKSTYRP